MNRGTILFVNGGSAVTPGRNATGTSVAFAGQAEHLWDLHTKCDRFRHQVSAD